jgi:hypothetical protein
MKSLESQEQQALFQWASMAAKQTPELELLHHIPNGGKRNKITAARLKKEGVKSGVPDVFLPVPRRNLHGLYIEMKAAKGKISDNQREWLERLFLQGYAVNVCYGWEEAKDIILLYLKGVVDGG